MYCPVCGKEIEDDKEQFCKYCKADISEKPTNEESPKVLCPNCSKEIDVGSGEVGFCKFCGSELIEESIDKQTTVIMCPRCNKEIDIGHGEIKFCKYCGSNVSTKYCQNCGKEIDKTDDESEFCKYCGVRLGETFTKIGSKKRPSSVTVISWIIIVISVIDGLIGFSVMASSNNSLGLSSGTIKWGFVSDIILILLAIGILKGLNWCRITFLIFYPINVLIIFSIQKSQIAYVLFYITFYIVVIIILTRPNAVRFFKAST